MSDLRRLTTTILPLLVLAGCGEEEPLPAPAAAPHVVAPVAAPAAVPLPPPQFPAAFCRVYTSEPGWQVFIDGSAVVSDDGGPFLTPCGVQAGPGSHTVTIARPGFRDLSRQVLFGDNAEISFDTASAAPGDSALLSAPYLRVAAGACLPLEALNSSGREFDPFLSPDGLSLWFAGDRSEGRGIFVATRSSPLHPFDQPVLLRLTSSADQAASPSLTADGSSVVYALPAKGRIRALARPSPLAEFESPRVLLSDESITARCPSAQVTAEGDRVYFVREEGAAVETRVAYRPSDPQQPWGNMRIVQLPGGHPRLSADGLRQYLFDGRTLSRARRKSLNDPFAPAEPIATLTLDRYRPSDGHRQFCVSEDEQWLFYSDDPVAGGDLWMARLSNGPAWGAPLRGSSIAPKVLAAAPHDEPEPLFEPRLPEVKPPPPDPRNRPLPYAAFRAELLELVGRRDFPAALDRIETAQADPALNDSAGQVEWDRQDVAQLLAFWRRVEAAVGKLKPGDPLRIGPVQVEFEKYAGGVLTGKTRTKTIDKPLRELDAASLVSLAEADLDRKDPTQALGPAVFLTYCNDGSSGRRGDWLKSAGEGGTEFVERLAAREARLAEQELARENISAALARIAEVERNHSGTAAAEAVVALRDQLYSRTRWRQAGRRAWQPGPLGEYTAGTGRADGAALVSPSELRSFELSLEYRADEPTGQGGVYFRYAGSGRLDAALKVQLSNDAGVNPDVYCTGALFGIEAPKVNAAKPQGEWNTLQMTVIDARLTVTINGKQVLRTTFAESDRPKSGYVALDGVTGGISYRKIILSDNPATPQ